MRPPALALFALPFALVGCGGGSSRADAGKTSLTIDWPATTRSFGGSPIAGSARVIFSTTATTPVEVYNFAVVRPSGTSEVKKSYTFPTKLTAGSYSLAVRFCKGADANLANEVGLGVIIATVTSNGKLVGSDGEGLGDVAFTNTLSSLALAPNQTVRVGQRTSLDVSATSPGGGIVAIPDSQVTLSVASGSALQANGDGTVTGVAAGSATVVAKAFGIQSAPVAVTVTAG